MTQSAQDSAVFYVRREADDGRYLVSEEARMDAGVFVLFFSTLSFVFTLSFF